MPASIRTHGVCHMAVYEHGNKRVLAVKGTSASSGHDLLQDLKMVVGGEISRTATQATLGDATELISKFGVNLVTGHSLGGYYAEIIATTNRLCGVSFCNPGVNGPKVKLGGVPIRGFQNINFEHDALGNVYAGVYQHVQWSVYVSTGSVSHGIETMMEYFDGRRDITNMNVVRRSSSHMTGYYNPN